MVQSALEQNHHRLQLQQWEQKLQEREMHLLEMELKLCMTPANNVHHERPHQTPKVQKRSGHFMRSLLQSTLNGHAHLSSTTANHVISNPTSLFVLIEMKSIIFYSIDFRHILSVCRDDNNSLQHRYHPSTQPGSSATLPPNFSKSSSTPTASASSQTLPTRSSANGHHSSSSTPTTPNLNRLRTLTCTYRSFIDLSNNDGENLYNSS